jgi:hypothetical protein
VWSERVGDVLLAQGNLDEALARYEASLAIRGRLAALDRSNASWQHDLAASYAKVATTLERQGAVALALAELRAGRSIIAALVGIAPGQAEWQANLAWFDQQIARLEAQAQQAGSQ